MPTATAFQTTYLVPGTPGAITTGALRSRVAGALWTLQHELQRGTPVANAHLLIDAQSRHVSALTDAETTNPGIRAAFDAIDAP
jgi:hypothetical protein